MKTFEVARNKKRRELFDAHDRIDAQRDDLIAGLERRLRQRERARPLFMVRRELRKEKGGSP